MNALLPPNLPSWQNHDHLSLLGREAPRYTSYPSAHHFTGLGPETYGQWLKALEPQTSIALYVHIPFCEQMCTFCGCHTHQTRRYDPVLTYVEALVAEFELVGAQIGFRPKVHALHFGGGSPSILKPAEMTRVMQTIGTHFELLTDAEISLEIDPRRVDEDKIKTYQALGFNRVSIGVQDTDLTVQDLINRIQPLSLLQTVFGQLRAHGLGEIGIDIIYGLPGQTQESIEQTLKDIMALDPKRISAFSYAHVPWVKKHQRLIDEARLPDLNAKVAAFLTISETLIGAGYEAIGIDHFAKRGDGLSIAKRLGRLRRNFMGYTDTNNDILLGFGASSISELPQGLIQNIPQTTTYQNTIHKGQLASHRGHAFSGDDEVRKAIIMDIMCRFECDLKAITARFGLAPDTFDTELASLKPLQAQGLVTIKDRHLSFHSPLLMLARTVACHFDSYARKQQETLQNRYSKVA